MDFIAPLMVMLENKFSHMYLNAYKLEFSSINNNWGIEGTFKNKNISSNFTQCVW